MNKSQQVDMEIFLSTPEKTGQAEHEARVTWLRFQCPKNLTEVAGKDPEKIAARSKGMTRQELVDLLIKRQFPTE